MPLILPVLYSLDDRTVVLDATEGTMVARATDNAVVERRGHRVGDPPHLELGGRPRPHRPDGADQPHRAAALVIRVQRRRSGRSALSDRPAGANTRV
jgi:hypothetical protein